MNHLLVVVDYQNDFVDGALGFPGAETLEEGIYSAVQKTLAEGGYVLFTRDTHDSSYLSTREGKHLPLAHCVKGTHGHALYGRLHEYETQAVPHTMVIDKALFGCAQIGEYAQRLCGGAPGEIELCGLVTDICVITNAILLHSAFPLAEVKIRKALCGSGNEQNQKSALDIMAGLGMEIIP